MPDFEVQRDGVTLSGTEAGEGPPVILLHGLTATRDYVIHGSRALERAGHRVIAYDARGHGRSTPAPSYDYEDLVADLAAVMDDRGVEDAVLAGASMGAHTVVRFALDHPDRARVLVIITPAFDPDSSEVAGRWDRLATGLRTDNVDGFIEASKPFTMPEQWHDTVLRIMRRRIGAHEHPDAVADALEAVPRSRPFADWSDLERISAPAAVVVSRDEADPDHPHEIGERYATSLPGAVLHSERPGDSPLAWQGGRLARIIADAS